MTIERARARGDVDQVQAGLRLREEDGVRPVTCDVAPRPRQPHPGHRVDQAARRQHLAESRFGAGTRDR